MLSFKKAAVIIGAVLLLTVLFFIFGTPKYQSMKIKNKNFTTTSKNLKEAVNTSTEVDFNKITDFAWDECYVFTPYYSSKSIYEEVGLEWTTLRTYIGFLLFHDMENETVHDNQYLIVFKKDNKVILSEIYDLNQLPVTLKLDNHKFTWDNARFLVNASSHDAEGKVKELVLIK